MPYGDNVEFIESSEIKGWFKVRINGLEGYVFSKYVKKGKCFDESYEYRVGAKCKDGTTSSATGRGACSHHGGVDYWLMGKKKSYRISKE